jgi:hypothetical protein
MDEMGMSELTSIYDKVKQLLLAELGARSPTSKEGDDEWM